MLHQEESISSDKPPVFVVMGHRKDSKRFSSLFSSPISSSSLSSSSYGSPSHFLPVEGSRDNAIPQLHPDLLLGGGGGFSPLTRAHSPFAYQPPPPRASRPEAGPLDRPVVLPLGAFPLEEVEEAEEPVGVDREVEEASGRILLKDFLQFLRLKGISVVCLSICSFISMSNTFMGVFRRVTLPPFD